MSGNEINGDGIIGARYNLLKFNAKDLMLGECFSQGLHIAMSVAQKNRRKVSHIADTAEVFLRDPFPAQRRRD
jgi:hypothetical protein